MFAHFLDYFRCPEDFASVSFPSFSRETAGFFRFGPDTVCYGTASRGRVSPHVNGLLVDVAPFVSLGAAGPELPFSPGEVIDNLRFERYCGFGGSNSAGVLNHSGWQEAYYSLRNLLPAPLRQWIHRSYFRGWEKIPFPGWPVDFTVEQIFERLAGLSLEARGEKEMPFIWFWPGGAPYCILLTHDVETRRGRDFCTALMDHDDQFGIKAAFQVIPEERYDVPPAWREEIRRRGFEINVHDLNHDGRLYTSREIFLQRARRINEHVKAYGASGFRSGALYRRVDWYDALEISYDMSVPNTGRLEVQRGGCCTVMPYFIGNVLEIPLTTTQDYVLFNVLGDYLPRLWAQQLEQIAARHGLASFIIHPDYVRNERAFQTYRMLLQMIASQREERHPWVTLPGEVNQWWRDRNASHLERHRDAWRIVGPAKDRGQVALAHREGDRVVFQFAPETSKPQEESHR